MSLNEYPQRVKRPASDAQIKLLKRLHVRLGIPNECQGQELSMQDASRLIDDAQQRLASPPIPPSDLTLEQEIKDLFN